MQLTPTLIYLWGIADDASNAFGLLAGLAGIASLFTFVIGLVEGEQRKYNTEEENAAAAVIRTNLWKYTRRLVGLFVFSLVATVLLPSSKTIAIMAVAPAIVNSEPLQKDVPELYKLGLDALKQKLSEVAK